MVVHNMPARLARRLSKLGAGRVLSASSLLSPPALAYETYGWCYDGPPVWEGGAVAFSVNTISFSSSSQRSAAEEGVDQWDDSTVPGTDFAVSHGTNSYSTTADDDGVNMIAAVEMYSYANCAFATSIAVTEIRGADCDGGYGLPSSYILETDILVNACYSWTSSDTYYDFTYPYSIEQVVLHEGGHAAGLDHWSGSGFPASMNNGEGGGSVIGESSFASTRRFYANEDDREGLRYLYPDSGNSGYDLAVQSYVWYDDGDSYSDLCGEEATRPSPWHDLSLLAVEEGRNPEDCPSTVPTDPVDDLFIYPGVSFEATFNYLNLGSIAASGIRTRLYLTTNPLTMADATPVDTWTMSLGPDVPWQVTHELEVPSSTAPGIWYLVSVIDYDESFSEWDESNNQAVWNRRIEVGELPECGCSSTKLSGRSLYIGLLAMLGLARRRRS